MNIPYFRPSIGEEEKRLVDAVLTSGWLTTGQYARRFEEAFASYLGAPQAVAVNSCTAALHLALEASGIGPGDLVLVPTMTFAATAAAVRFLGGRPVLVDCDPVTMNMDPEAAEQTAELWSRYGNLRGIIPVHYGGQMADMDRLGSLARRWDLAVVEDAAHACPAYTRPGPASPWQPVGATSPLACFSFYANKCITTGEGGMVTVQNPDTAERIRRMSLHGLSKSAWRRFEAKVPWHYEILDAGFKYNLTDLAAAIGLAQLEKAGRMWQDRRRVARLYAERLAAYQEFLELPVELPDRQSSWHLYPIRLRLESLDIDRNAFIAALGERGITCSVHWMPLHLHPAYREAYGYRLGDFPVASSLWPRLVSLPMFPSMTEAEVDYVCDSIGALVGRQAAAPALALCG